jgi:hypothetical protein
VLSWLSRRMSLLGAQVHALVRHVLCKQCYMCTVSHPLYGRLSCITLPVHADMSDFMKQDMERFSRQQPAATAAKQAEQQVRWRGSHLSFSMPCLAIGCCLCTSTWN